MSRIRIDIDSRCLHSEHSPEQYGSWSAAYEKSLGDVHLDDTGEPLVFDVASGDVVYIVLAVYSLGDSFGSARCGGDDVIAVFKTEHLADFAVKLLESNDDVEHCKILLEDGQVLTYYKPWVGYFESLDSLCYEARTVK